MLILLTTTPNEAEAKKIARGLIAEQLAACVQILPEMVSIYFWEGEVREETERLLLIKTTEEKYGEVEAFIRKNHSYDVPEVVAIAAEKVSENYLAWMSGYINGT